MNQIKQFTIWLLKAWPFTAIFIIALIHREILKVCSSESAEILNRTMSAFMQISGGLLVLFTINANIGLFEKEGLGLIFINWLKSFPLFRNRKPNTCHVNDILPGFKISAESHSTRVCTTIEEKIEEAQRQIDELRNIVDRKERELLAKVGEVEKNLKKLIYKTQNGINALNGLLTKTTIGGISAQIFGVLLVIYGALIPLIARH